jgi:hypothetical protein
VPRPASEYEFLSIESVNSTDNIILRRWAQGANPYTAMHEDVVPGGANSTFRHILNMNERTGGLRRGDNNRAYWKLAVIDSSNWWYGAFGCYKREINDQMPYNGGIPVVRGNNEKEYITAGILDLYMRIDPTKITYKEFKNGIIMPNTINEF